MHTKRVMPALMCVLKRVYMGFFSGITKAVGGLLGGGGSSGGASATNSTANTTNITNQIDMKPIADAIASGNATTAQAINNSTALFSEISKQSAEGLKSFQMALNAMISTEAKSDAVQIEQINNGFKIIAVLGGAGLAYIFTSKKKGSK